MKANKIRKKDVTKFEISGNAMQKKDRIINLMVFTIVFFIALLILSQILK